uniref:Uncharacterized protein n=1 Tax=Arundo donax TaxID=35708 RepID=A0A0A9A0B3_ARUDO
MADGSMAMGIAGPLDKADAYLKRLAATAPGTENIAYALRAARDTRALVTGDDQPGYAGRRLSSLVSVALASRQVSEMEAMAREALFTVSRWLTLKAVCAATWRRWSMASLAWATSSRGPPPHWPCAPARHTQGTTARARSGPGLPSSSWTTPATVWTRRR